MKSKLLQNEELAHQAGSTSEEELMLGDFKEIFSNTTINSLDAQNGIAKQLLFHERIFAAMQRMIATAVYKAFKAQQPPL